MADTHRYTFVQPHRTSNMRGERNVNCGLWVIMVCCYRFTAWGVLIVGRPCMCGGRRYMGNLCTPARFLCESKTALKKPVLIKIKTRLLWAGVSRKNKWQNLTSKCFRYQTLMVTLKWVCLNQTEMKNTVLNLKHNRLFIKHSRHNWREIREYQVRAIAKRLEGRKYEREA